MIKPQWNATINTPTWLKLIRLAVSNVMKDMEQLELLCINGVIVKTILNTLKNCFLLSV